MVVMEYMQLSRIKAALNIVNQQQGWMLRDKPDGERSE